MKTRAWILLFAAILAALILSAVLIGRPAPGRTLARVYLDGACVWEVDLAGLTSPVEYRVDTDSGSNVIQARPGGIRVLEADCPDQVCVRQGWLERGRTPIVCLPHRLVIQLEENAENTENAENAEPLAPDAISG